MSTMRMRRSPIHNLVCSQINWSDESLRDVMLLRSTKNIRALSDVMLIASPEILVFKNVVADQMCSVRRVEHGYISRLVSSIVSEG